MLITVSDIVQVVLAFIVESNVAVPAVTIAQPILDSRCNPPETSRSNAKHLSNIMTSDPLPVNNTPINVKRITAAVFMRIIRVCCMSSSCTG